jgi:NAD+ synthase
MDNMRMGNTWRGQSMIVPLSSGAFNGLVVGTGNKTEILLGYTTLYGDFSPTRSTDW